MNVSNTAVLGFPLGMQVSRDDPELTWRTAWQHFHQQYEDIRRVNEEMTEHCRMRLRDEWPKNSTIAVLPCTPTPLVLDPGSTGLSVPQFDSRELREAYLASGLAMVNFGFPCTNEEHLTQRWLVRRVFGEAFRFFVHGVQAMRQTWPWLVTRLHQKARRKSQLLRPSDQEMVQPSACPLSQITPAVTGRRKEAMSKTERADAAPVDGMVMPPSGKRDATPEETEKALKDNALRWNAMNPSFQETEQYWRDKQDEAESEGYKSEVCRCGTVFLAFHHFCACREDGCPMSDGVSLLERMAED